MKLIKPKAELLLQQPGLEGVYKQIELAGRTCYKSTDKITEDSAKPFVDRMINSKHLAMLEHGTVYLKRIVDYSKDDYNIFEDFYEQNPYSKMVYDSGVCYTTTNLRVLVENNRLNDLKYICEPTEDHVKRYTFRLTTSIGVTRELNRHRVNSIAEMSTRYCNYSKDKFGNEVTFCLPSWLSSTEYTEMNSEERIFFRSCEHAEFDYLRLISKGWKPQQAREVLPLCTATEIIHTAYASDWRHFFDLRYFGTTGAPHPNMVELTGLMAKEADKYGIWEELCNQNVEVAN